MPELPEVQTTVSRLNKLLSGLKITDVWSDYHSLLYEGKLQIKNDKYFKLFKKDVIGSKVKDVSRRAKNVLINLAPQPGSGQQNSKTILIHMKMTGHLLYGKYRRVGNSKFNLPIEVLARAGTLNSKQTQKSNTKIQNGWEKEIWIPAEKKSSPLWDSHNRFIHLVFSFSNGRHLVLSDVRKFAKVAVFDSKNIKKSDDLRKIGPEPLHKNFSFTVFKERVFKKPNGKIKQVLMDQEIIAGIGNIYSDEILWRSAVHPESAVSKIPEKSLKEIFKAISFSLKKGLDFKGDSTSDYRMPNGERGSYQLHHQAYRRTGQKCLKKNCRGEIKRIKIGGRSGHFCDEHQKFYR